MLAGLCQRALKRSCGVFLNLCCDTCREECVRVCLCVSSSQRDDWGLPALKLKCDERLTARWKEAKHRTSF